jgi:diaminopimelate epimerase
MPRTLLRSTGTCLRGSTAVSEVVVIASFPFVRAEDGGGDVIIVPDPEGAYPLGPGWAVMLCDRRTGIGGDGVMRIVPVYRDEMAPAGFQDAVGRYVEYWTADGSPGEVGARIQDLIAWYLATYEHIGPGTGTGYTVTGMRRVEVPGSGFPDAAA